MTPSVCSLKDPSHWKYVVSTWRNKAAMPAGNRWLKLFKLYCRGTIVKGRDVKTGQNVFRSDLNTLDLLNEMCRILHEGVCQPYVQLKQTGEIVHHCICRRTDCTNYWTQWCILWILYSLRPRGQSLSILYNLLYVIGQGGSSDQVVCLLNHTTCGIPRKGPK